MALAKPLLFICLAMGIPLHAAGEDPQQRLPARDEIEFEPASKLAFDRSGKAVRHRVLENGVLMAEHNGSIGNVTVARLGPDGRIETLCTGDEEAARAWMSGEGSRGRTDTLELQAR